MISTLGAQILGFDNIIELYSQDPEFSSIYTKSQHKPQEGYYVNQGYLFREGKLCIPHGSHRKLLVKESHEGGLTGHFGVEKTLNILREKFYWPHMRRAVQRYCYKCIACLQAKSKTTLHGLYTPLLVPLGRILVWILSLDYLELKGVLILFLWLWIDLVKWHISFHVTK